MTTQEALDLLVRATGELNSTRGIHMKIQEALAIIDALVQKDGKTTPVETGNKPRIT